MSSRRRLGGTLPKSTEFLFEHSTWKRRSMGPSMIFLIFTVAGLALLLNRFVVLKTFFACAKCRASSSSLSRGRFLLAVAFVATGLLKIFMIIIARSFFAICPSEHILRSKFICAVVLDSSSLFATASSSCDDPPAPGAASSGVEYPSDDSEYISKRKRFVFCGKKKVKPNDCCECV